MSILNIAGYHFTTLTDLPLLKRCLQRQCETLQLKGTILLSPEGVNLSLAGTRENIASFQSYLQQQPAWQTMRFHESLSEEQPFKQLKVKIKKEIITFRQPEADPTHGRAPSLSPQTLKQWLEEKRDILLLDTRNDYEVELGTFTGAFNMHLAHFTDLPAASQSLPTNKPIVMFCTGGIRCEKAALYLLNQGFPEVYQLDGGILNYFATVGAAYYEGSCFVFDERVSVTAPMMLAAKSSSSSLS